MNSLLKKVEIKRIVEKNNVSEIIKQQIKIKKSKNDKK